MNLTDKQWEKLGALAARLLDGTLTAEDRAAIPDYELFEKLVLDARDHAQKAGQIVSASEIYRRLRPAHDGGARFALTSEVLSTIGD